MKSKCCNSEYLAVYSNTEETEYVCYACDHVCDITNPSPLISTEVEEIQGLMELFMPSEAVTKATQSITRLIQQAELRGRIEQVMQDFISINNEFDLDESHLIDWRDNEIAQLTKGGSDATD